MRALVEHEHGKPQLVEDHAQADRAREGAGDGDAAPDLQLPDLLPTKAAASGARPPTATAPAQSSGACAATTAAASAMPAVGCVGSK